jgi:hypothetical protein
LSRTSEILPLSNRQRAPSKDTKKITKAHHHTLSPSPQHHSEVGAEKIEETKSTKKIDLDTNEIT